MQLAQIGDKARAHRVLDAGGSQRIRQAPEQVRHLAHQFASRFARVLGLHAPDQQVHGFQCALPGVAVLALFDLDQEQDLDPLPEQELDHRGRQPGCAQAHLDLCLRHGLGECEAFLLFDLLFIGLRLLLDALVFLDHQRLHLLAHGVENLDVFLETFHESLEHCVQAREGRIGGIDVRGQPRSDFAERIEHMAGWMGRPGEEGLVRNRDLEEGNLQPADQALYADRDLGIVE